MKVLQLDVKGLRSLYDVSWKLGDFNVVIGPNGSGKTSLLTALDLLSHSARGRLVKQVQRYNGMERLAWMGEAPKISFQLKTSSTFPNWNANVGDLVYRLDLAQLETSNMHRVEYELLCSVSETDSVEKEQPLKLLERTPTGTMVYDAQKQSLSVLEKSLPEGETLLSLSADWFPTNRLLRAYQRQLSSWQIFSPYFRLPREFIAPQVNEALTTTCVAPDGRNFVSVLYALYTGNPQFKRDLDIALAAALDLNGEKLVLSTSNRRIQLGVQRKGLQNALTLEHFSEGMLQFLFLITVLANPDPPPLVAIDDPVSALSLSAKSIVAEYAVEAAARTQVVIATHSSEFLNAFSHTPPTMTVLDYKEGKTRLRMVSDETLRYWLKEYSLGKLYRSGELEDME